MGTNKRYADGIDRRMDARINESIMRGAQPASLSNAQLEFELEPLTQTPDHGCSEASPVGPRISDELVADPGGLLVFVEYCLASGGSVIRIHASDVRITLPLGPGYAARQRRRLSVLEVLHTIGLPVLVTPVEPAPEQKAPACT